MDKQANQRRRVPRRTFTRQVGVLIRGAYKLCQAVQIGEGGILIESIDELKVGQHVVITLFIPGTTQAVIRAMVRYARPGVNPKAAQSYGLQFEGVEFNVRRQIRNYVAAKSVQEAHDERKLQRPG